MKIDSLEDAQVELLRMLRSLHDIASESGLEYYLAYGTALGAIRERDLIAWDTDADVIVPVDMYEELCEALSTSLPNYLELRKPGAPWDYEHLFARIAIRGLDHNLLHVDLFPMAGAPSSRALRSLTIRVAKAVNLGYMLRIADPTERYTYDLRKQRIAGWAKRVLSLIPVAVFSATYRRLSRLSDYRSSDVVYNVAGSYGLREFIPRRLLGDCSTRAVRGVDLRLPCDAESYLRHMYGDYATPPDIETRQEAVDFFEQTTLPRITAALRRGSAAD